MDHRVGNSGDVLAAVRNVAYWPFASLIAAQKNVGCWGQSGSYRQDF
jgi:hypothetical protein